MKIIHHGQRPQSTCWLCPGSNARVLGWESHTQGQCQLCSNPQEVCSALSWGQGSKAPCWSPQGCWCPPPLRAHHLKRSPEWLAGTARPFPCGWAVSPRCCGDGTGRQQVGGGRARIEDRISPELTKGTGYI